MQYICVVCVEHMEKVVRVITCAGIDRHPREGPAEVWREELAEGICMEDA